MEGAGLKGGLAGVEESSKLRRVGCLRSVQELGI